ncbi:MAG: helix-turn-helix domain-containing protein [Lentisphaeria bacterium]|nr:helix-turn-helix domain-containing protein [Lentisphaeria bacterium]
MQDFIREIEEAFSALSLMTGASVIWKTTLAFHPNRKLDHEYRSHRCAFCSGVKALGPGFEEACIGNDFRLINRRVFEERRPFAHECHAGACELVVPFFNRDRYVGTILCGPFRSGNSRCAYREAAELFSALPPLTPERGAAYIRILSIVAARLMPLLEKLEEQIYYLADRDAVSDGRILEAVRHMELNFKRRLSQPELARHASLSESRFSHLFRQQTRMSFREYLLRIRLQEACRLLRGTDLTILEVARQAGIGSQSRLAAMVKRRFGMTPLAYRRKYSVRPMS